MKKKEVMDLLSRTRESAQEVKDLDEAIVKARASLREGVERYLDARAKLILVTLKEHDLTWCTGCSVVLASSDVQMLFTEGRAEESGGYENSCYGFSSFARLHRACPQCYERWMDRHGTRGTYDHIAKDQAYFNAFRAEERPDGYYARKFGDWQKLDEKYRLDDLPLEFLNGLALADEWNLPPLIELKGGLLSKAPELIIYDEKVPA